MDFLRNGQGDALVHAKRFEPLQQAPHIALVAAKLRAQGVRIKQELRVAVDQGNFLQKGGFRPLDFVFKNSFTFIIFIFSKEQNCHGKYNSYDKSRSQTYCNDYDFWRFYSKREVA